MNKIETAKYLESLPKKRMGNNIPLYGVGVVDTNFPVYSGSVNGRKCMHPAYRAWSGCMQRAFSHIWKTRYPTYADCTVHPDWFRFSNFLSWWWGNYREGFDLDKDMLVPGNKEYGPDTCLFIPPWFNRFFIHNKQEGRLLGAGKKNSSGRVRSLCSNPLTNEQEHLGYFDTEIEAHLAWFDKKLYWINFLAQDLREIDPRLPDAALAKLYSMRENH